MEKTRTDHPACNCWTTDDSLGVLGASGEVGMKIPREGWLFNKGDVIATVGGKDVIAPFYATVVSITKDAFVADGGLLITFKDVNPTYKCFFVPPLEIVKVPGQGVSERELYRRHRRNMNLPGTMCHTVGEVVDLLCDKEGQEEEK